MSGAAGTDKSRFLKTVKRVAKEELGRDGFVQEAAPSGTAAYLINETQHSFLNFPVVTSTFLPLHGELLKGIQDTFSNGGTLFIDWKSMVGEKLFTMVGKRLQEAHPPYTDKPFGNISVITYWDFNQLPQVCDSPLFKANAVIPSGYNLYQLFDKTITFTELVRQQGEDQAYFRAQLTRLGEGVFTREDWMSWRFTYLNMLPATVKAIFLENAILARAKKKYMIEHNMNKVKTNMQPIAPIVTECYFAAVKSESADQAAGLPMKTIISKNIIFMLISNMWTEAGLTNGSEADIHGIIYDSQKRHPSLPVALIATFNSYIGPSFLPGLGNSVPICPVTTDWHSQKMKLTRRMCTIILGYALSIHKLQSNTSYSLILN